MEQCGRENDSWEDLVEKAINAEAKASLQAPSNLREMNQRCLRGNRPTHTTVPKSQAFATRDSRSEPSEKKSTQDSKRPYPSHSKNGEASNKKARKEKKKKQRRRDAE